MNSASLSTDEIRRKVDALGPWFHNLDLHGVPTAPSHFLGDYPAVKWQNFADVVPKSLKGKTVLDIGCNAGFYTMEMKRRGAERVLGLDSRDEYLAQARFAAEVNDLDVEFRNLSVYDVGKLGETFDLVIFMGVLYHLRHPLLALDLIYEHVAGDMMLFQSMQRGSAGTAELDQKATNFPNCTLSNTATPTIQRIGGFRIEVAPKPCCAARVSSSLPIRNRKCIYAGAAGALNRMAPSTPRGEAADDRGCKNLERAQ
jgi:tRNA (mo5U34)-methyltransferase